MGTGLVDFSLGTPFVGMVSFPERTLPMPRLGGTSQTWGRIGDHSVGGSSFHLSGFSSACPGFFCNWGEMIGKRGFSNVEKVHRDVGV